MIFHQTKNFNMVIPILIHFCPESEHFKLHKAACPSMKFDIINDVKLLLSQIFDVILSEITLQKASALDFLFLLNFSMKLRDFLNMEFFGPAEITIVSSL